jgi:hypothetical protein
VYLSEQVVVSDGREIVTRRVDPHRLAWGVLLAAFAIFCSIAIVIIAGINYFLFQSAVPIKSMLSLGRGTVGIMELANSIEQIGRNGDMLLTGTVITTDPQSQGTIQFLDPQAADDLVAAVTLHNGSALTLRQAARPRFEWSQTRHVIELGNVSGRFSVTVPSLPGRNVLVNIETGAGAIVNLEGAGRYMINASGDQLSVINREGAATFIPPDLRQGHSIPVDRQGIIHYSDNTVEQKPGYVNLVKDSSFQTLNGGQLDLQAWVCGNDPSDNPSGRYDFLSMNGLLPLRFIRADNATTHGRTSCVQSFGQGGVDITALNYNYLGVRATLNIESQSLNACGSDGSECPLMLRMDYIDDTGKGQRWFHGFYSREADPQSNYRQRCASCIQDHDLINQGAWYTYESPNLLTLLEETPPVSIVSIWFYASGHQWDVRIGEIALIGAHVDNVEVLPPSVEPTEDVDG